jgi:hypothetical protein
MWQKQADAVGSASPDPSTSLASADPVPKPSFANKPPPGHTGPRGMQPRQTYSRVNTGAPPIPDAGASSQKSMEPRGLEFLPKLSEVMTMPEMTMTARPYSLNDMIKAAMDGSLARTDVTAEAIRQMGATPVEKTASSDAGPLSTEVLMKLADALDYVGTEIEKGAEIQLPHPTGGDLAKPGTGPGALKVTKATTDGKNPSQPGNSGGKAPSTGGTEHGANPHMPNNMPATNASMHHGEQPVDPMGNKKHASVIERLKKLSSAPVTTAAPAVSSFIADLRKTAASLQTKVAEDAINPAQISAPASVDTSKSPPGATPSGEGVPSQPADVSAQERLIDSNKAAIDATKREVKADAVSDAGRVFVNTPMKDPVLDQVFAHSGQAGVKTSSVQGEALKIAAARSLLSKLAADAVEEAKKKGKEKESNMGGGSPPPPGVPSPAFTQ